MTIEEKFAKGIVVYQNEDEDYVCELWASSTKHPDTMYFYSEWGDKSQILEDKYQIFQWLLWIASRCDWPFHAKEIANLALTEWYNW